MLAVDAVHDVRLPSPQGDGLEAAFAGEQIRERRAPGAPTDDGDPHGPLPHAGAIISLREARHGQEPAVRAKLHTQDAALLGLQGQDLPAGSRVPHFDRAIARGGKATAVRAEYQVVHLSPVAAEG